MSISVLLLFRHYISHKITFGAPSSGGVLCSACGAFIADDTSFYIIVDSPEEASQTINQDLVRISAWAEKWLVSFNPNKTEYILLSRKLNKPVHPPVIMNNQVITEVESRKHLGVTFESSGTWHKHIQ